MATIKFTTDKGSEFKLEFNTERHTAGGNIHVNAGGSEHRTGQSAYEADKGFILLEFMPSVVSQWGESGYTTSLTARESNVEKIEKINEVIEGLVKKADEKDNKTASETIQWMRKYILDYYMKATSINARFEVNAYAKSREIKVAGVVVDTKTANIEMAFTFRIMKLITPEEFQLLTAFFDDAIAQGAGIVRTFE